MDFFEPYLETNFENFWHIWRSVTNMANRLDLQCYALELSWIVICGYVLSTANSNSQLF